MIYHVPAAYSIYLLRLPILYVLCCRVVVDLSFVLRGECSVPVHTYEKYKTIIYVSITAAAVNLRRHSIYSSNTIYRYYMYMYIQIYCSSCRCTQMEGRTGMVHGIIQQASMRGLLHIIRITLYISHFAWRSSGGIIV